MELEIVRTKVGTVVRYDVFGEGSYMNESGDEREGTVWFSFETLSGLVDAMNAMEERITEDREKRLRDALGLCEKRIAKEKARIIESGEEVQGNSRLEYPSAFAIIEWPDGTETCAWRSEHIRSRGTDERNVRVKKE